VPRVTTGRTHEASANRSTRPRSAFPVGPHANQRHLSVDAVSVDLVGRPTVDLLRTDSALCR